MFGASWSQAWAPNRTMETFTGTFKEKLSWETRGGDMQCRCAQFEDLRGHPGGEIFLCDFGSKLGESSRLDRKMVAYRHFLKSWEFEACWILLLIMNFY